MRKIRAPPMELLCLKIIINKLLKTNKMKNFNSEYKNISTDFKSFIIESCEMYYEEMIKLDLKRPDLKIYSLESIKVLDAFIGDVANDAYKADSIKWGSRYTSEWDSIYHLQFRFIGLYTGQTIINLYGGEWVYNKCDKSLNDLHIKADPIMIINPMQKVWKRFLNGEEDNLSLFVKSTPDFLKMVRNLGAK